MEPLLGVDDVRWSEMSHACGAAEDVPRLLSMLTEGDERRAEAITELFQTIWHQGTTYEATAAAVPFLARLATSDPSLLPELAYLLGCIADGHPHPDPKDKAARDAVRAELPGLISAVRAHLTRPVTAGFCRLAYAFPDQLPALDETLDEAFRADDVTPLDQAGIAIAALRGGDTTYTEIVLLDVLGEALETDSAQD